MSNLIKRSITGGIYVAVIVGCLLGGAASSYMLYALLSVLCVLEYEHIVEPYSVHRRANSLNPLLTLCCAVCCLLLGCDVTASKGFSLLLTIIALLLIIALILVNTLWGDKSEDNAEPHYTLRRTHFLSAFFSLCCIGYFALTRGALLWGETSLAWMQTIDSCALPVLTLFVVLIFVNSLLADEEEGSKSWTHAFAVQFYVTLPFCLLTFLSVKSLLPLAIFVFLWVNDTGAYCVGSLLHKRFPAKLSPSISPNKTWVGAIGGGVFCIVLAFFMPYFSSSAILPYPHNPTPLFWIGFGLVACIAGTFGDLVESKIKRIAGIKDSGSLLPGHGGLLDRLDSALLAIPAVFFYLLYSQFI